MLLPDFDQLLSHVVEKKTFQGFQKYITLT